MTLLDFYGGDHGDVAAKFGAGSASSVNPPPVNSVGLWFGGQLNLVWALPATGHLFGGGHFTSNQFDGLARVILYIYGDAGATQHLAISFTNTTMTVWRGPVSSGTVLATVSKSFVTWSWYHLQFEVTIADSGGVFKVWIDDTLLVDFTGDTRNGGTSTNVDAVGLAASGTPAYWDNWWFADDVDATATQGAPFNTRLGQAVCRLLSPTAAGSSTQFTPDSGSNYARVNEIPVSAANYVQSNTSGHKDLYALADLPASVTSGIQAVKATALAKLADGGAASLHNVIRSGGVDYSGSDAVLGATDKIVSTIWTKDPATGSLWTPSGVNALELGFQRA